MREAGVDISRQHAKRIGELPPIQFDYVVTVCDRAADQCPAAAWQGTVVHAPFDDPPRLAAMAGDEEAALAPYRRVRDEIAELVRRLQETLTDARASSSSPITDAHSRQGCLADGD